MPTFEYTGQLRGGQAISGTLEAQAIEQVRSQLEGMGIQVASVASSARMRVPRPLTREDIVFFNQQLASMASTGIALDQGLRILAKDLRRGRLRRTIEELSDDLSRGVPLEHAVQKRSASFPMLYSEILKSGVRNNRLGATLYNLNSHLSLATAGRRLFWESAAYPIIVVLIGLSLLTFFMMAIVPQLRDLSNANEPMEVWDSHTGTYATVAPPVLTQVMFVLADHWITILGVGGIATAVLLLVWAALRLSPAGRDIRERLILRIPGISHIYRASLLARFAQAGALGVAGGQDLPSVLRLSAGATGSPALLRDADKLSRGIEAGGAVDVAGEGLRIIPGIVSFTIRSAGERGQLDAALTDLAQNYDALARHRLAMLRMFLTPILIVLTAMILGTGIMAMFAPILRIIGSMTG